MQIDFSKKCVNFALQRHTWIIDKLQFFKKKQEFVNAHAQN